MRIGFLPLLTTMCSFSHSAVAQPGANARGNAEVEVREFLANLENYHLKPNAKDLERCYADSFTATNPSGGVTDKAGVIEALTSGTLKYQSYHYEDVRIRIYGDTAIATDKVTRQGTYNGQDNSGQFSQLRVLVKQAGRWQLVATQVTRIVPQQSGLANQKSAQSAGSSRATVKMIAAGKANIEVSLRGAGPAVVLLPTGGATQYDEFAPILSAAGYRTIALSFRGNGQSSGPTEGLTLHDYAADVAAVIESLGVAPAHVLGRARGNRVARCLGSDHPDLVRSLILVPPGGLIRPTDPIAVAYLRDGPNAGPEEERPTRFRDAMLSRATDPARLKHIMSLSSSSSAAAKAFAAADAATPVGEWWAGGRAPMLVIQGLDDIMAPPANGRALHDQFRDRVKLVEVPNSGHALVWEQPERVAAEVVAFLKAHP